VGQLWNQIRILSTARKHGITNLQIRFAISHCGLTFVQSPSDDLTEPDRVLVLGDDHAGVPIEILAIEDDSGGLVVIHAMKMRRRYRRQYEEALVWRIVP
jgi:uncharacterized DUF497 family protein